MHVMYMNLTNKRPENIEKLLDLLLDSIDKPNCSVAPVIDVLLTILEPKTSN